jgi:ABC-type multidrug transport system fused ATPase/permease subunit
VLHDISFHVPAGSTVALIGATGSGKTTTASLIPRFYDPMRGSVLIDGRDVRTFTLRSLRAQISLVLQEAVLFQGTIYDNIAYGSPNATSEQILAAGESANVVEFIDTLPDGYDTTVGERGASLSGGQRQRIAIARAIVRQAPILILDEPTVGLDAETEYLVLEALRRLMTRCTSIVIAHHLATIRAADMIVVLEHGRIVEMGSHEKLLESSGLYAKLLHRQTGEPSTVLEGQSIL